MRTISFIIFSIFDTIYKIYKAFNELKFWRGSNKSEK